MVKLLKTKDENIDNINNLYCYHKNDLHCYQSFWPKKFLKLKILVGYKALR